MSKITVKEVLEAHHAFSSETTLPKILGDGYLYSHNPVFKGIRDATNFLGYTFVENGANDLSAIPFLGLQRILDRKEIPYQDSATELDKLERTKPGRFHMTRIDFTGKNVIFHESCHGIAEIILPEKSERLADLDESRQKAFRMLCAEAYATSSEVLGSLFPVTPVSQYLYGRNSYVAALPGNTKHHPPRYRAARECLPTYGAAFTQRIIYLSSLMTLFLRKRGTRADLERVLGIIAPESRFAEAEMRFLLNVLQINCYALSHFTIVTNSFYFKYYLDLQEELSTFLDFDYLSVFESDKRWINRLALLSEITELGVKGPKGRILVNSLSGKAKLSEAA
jgi:hypothetical protein